jgi:putative FmdB family regulatory protein
MPFYEYICDSCGHQFEKLQSINAKPLSKCDKCGEAIRRIIFPSAIVYKGSGFYSTEYGNSRFNHPSDKSLKDKSIAGNSDSAGSDKSTDKSTDKSDKSSSKESSPKDKCPCDSSSNEVKSSSSPKDSKNTGTSVSKASSSSGS